MIARRFPVAAALVALTALPLAAQTWSGNAATVPAQGFANSLVITGDELLAGRTNGFAIGTGDVVTFRRGVDGQWKESGTFTGTGLEIGDGFGSVMAADGAWLAVGAPGAKGGGRVHLFQRVGRRWTSVATLASPDTGAVLFGLSLAYQNGLLIVGAPGRDSLRGEVYAYRRDARGRMSGPVSVAKGGEAFDRLGFAVALDKGRVVVGAPGPGNNAPVPRRRGAASVYEASAGEWQETARLDAGPDSVLAFGGTVYMDADGIVVGAPVTRANQGVAFIYIATPSGWDLDQRVVAPEARPNQGFGATVVRQGRTLFVGAPASNQGRGVTHVFTREADGWYPTQALTGSGSSSTGMQFGARLVMAGSQLIVGGPSADFQQGSAFLFRRDADGLWRHEGTLKDAEKMLAAVDGKEVACAAGKAAAFDCGNVDLLAFMPKSALGAPRGIGVNDIWGWTDPETGREYALVGRMDGTSFVDVTDPSSPRFVGDLPMHQGANANVWRDIKVYKDHAFIVADGSGPHGMQVFDLTRLRRAQGAPVTFTEDAHYDRIASAHNIVINEGTGFAYVVGSNGGGETCGGALHMVDIRDVLHPAFAGCHADPATGIQRTGYTHDAQCVVYRGPDRRYTGREICFNSSETGVGIADVTDKASPRKLSVATYPNTAYAHQGWLNEAQTHFFLDDEGDEIQGSVARTRTLIWDVTDLEEPVLVKEHLGETAASDHNLYIRGNLMYQSNYVSGLRVLDVSNPTEPKEVGYFDTVPVGENNPGFAGSWSNYPYFKSGTVIVTSVAEGLFTVRYHPPQAMVP